MNETMQILHACAVRRWKRRALWFAAAAACAVAWATVVKILVA